MLLCFYERFAGKLITSYDDGFNSSRRRRRPQVSDPAVAFVLQRCRAAGPHLPYPSSPQGRGGNKQEALLVFLPSLSLGERGAGGVRAEIRHRSSRRRQTRRRDRLSLTARRV